MNQKKRYLFAKILNWSLSTDLTEELDLNVVLAKGTSVGTKLLGKLEKIDGGFFGLNLPLTETVSNPSGKCLIQTTVSALSGILSRGIAFHPTFSLIFILRQPENRYFVRWVII